MGLIYLFDIYQIFENYSMVKLGYLSTHIDEYMPESCKLYWTAGINKSARANMALGKKISRML